jgi:Ca2+-dependent lipid-binding protein
MWVGDVFEEKRSGGNKSDQGDVLRVEGLDWDGLNNNKNVGHSNADQMLSSLRKAKNNFITINLKGQMDR